MSSRPRPSTGGPDGLHYYRRLAQEAPVLRPAAGCSGGGRRPGGPGALDPGVRLGDLEVMPDYAGTQGGVARMKGGGRWLRRWASGGPCDASAIASGELWRARARVLREAEPWLSPRSRVRPGRQRSRPVGGGQDIRGQGRPSGLSLMSTSRLDELAAVVTRCLTQCRRWLARSGPDTHPGAAQV